MEKIRTFISNHRLIGAKATWTLFAVFALTLVIKVSTFHLFVWPGSAFYFFAKIYVPLFFAFFVLLSKRKYWTLVLMVLIDIWIICNIIYFRANNIILTHDAIMMAYNLDGFQSSIGLYINWQCFFYPLLTLIYALSLPFLYPKPQKIGAYIVGSLVVICFLIDSFNISKGLSKKEVWKCFIPFYEPQTNRERHNGRSHYANERTIVAYAPMVFISMLVDLYTDDIQEEIEWTDAELKLLQTLIQKDDTSQTIIPTHNVLFLLVESLEDFALHIKDPKGNYYLPNLHALLSQPDVLYANKITSQVRHGVSADGQMIYNTGLLPLLEGAAAMSYPNHTYPNFAHLYDVSVLSNATFDHVWNQFLMSSTYGYKQKIGGDKIIMHDSETLAHILPIWKQTPDSTICYFAITIDSHSPFKNIKRNESLLFDEDMPVSLQRYLNCLHCTDSCFGLWYNEWKASEASQNTVLVITGDHTIFRDAMLQELLPYAKKAQLEIASGKTFCPLIMQAPQIEQNIHITETCYQMDIYPTLLHLIGAENYFWKGFGVNLLDTTARTQRFISEEDALILSDKLIRSNYFATPR